MWLFNSVQPTPQNPNKNRTKLEEVVVRERERDKTMLVEEKMQEEAAKEEGVVSSQLLLNQHLLPLFCQRLHNSS